MIFLEDKKTRNKFVFLNSIRITVLSILILLFIKIQFSILPIILALTVGIVFSVLNFYLLNVLNNRFVFYIQSFVDISLITIFVYVSGGIISPIYFLYLYPIIVASYFLDKRETVYIASFLFIIFGTLSSLMYLEIIPSYPGVSAPNISRMIFVYNLIMSFIAFSSVSLISSYYFERIRKTGAELKNVQESLKDLVSLNNAVLEKMENGFITCDSNGIIISYNEKSKSLLNLNINTNIFELLFDRSDYKEIEKTTKIESRYYFEKEVNDLTLGISVSLIKDIYSFDKVFVFVITDLTEKRLIEEKLKKKEHFALIGEMSAGIAHEIRNPLASISGSVQFLEKEVKLDPEYKYLMNIIVKESNRLSKSIEEFLDFAKITPLNRSEIDLSKVIDDVIDPVVFNNKKVNFIKKYNRGNLIFADLKKMNQLVWNLVTNSVKAVNGKGDIEINIYRKNRDIGFSIKDNGVGIEKGELPKIFTPFYSKFSSGIGLGMNIVKRIIEEHNFDIKIDSAKNIGTEVTVWCKQM